LHFVWQLYSIECSSLACNFGLLCIARGKKPKASSCLSPIATVSSKFFSKFTFKHTVFHNFPFYFFIYLGNWTPMIMYQINHLWTMFIPFFSPSGAKNILSNCILVKIIKFMCDSFIHLLPLWNSMPIFHISELMKRIRK